VVAILSTGNLCPPYSVTYVDTDFPTQSRQDSNLPMLSSPSLDPSLIGLIVVKRHDRLDPLPFPVTRCDAETMLDQRSSQEGI
jgi:hypothetical protein